MIKPEPKCVVCNKPVDILIDKYFGEDDICCWKHNNCVFPSMIPSILNDNK